MKTVRAIERDFAGQAMGLYEDLRQTAEETALRVTRRGDDTDDSRVSSRASSNSVRPNRMTNSSLAATQLWLFPPPRPLVERLGEDFFRTLPAQPAVYLFCGDQSGVLYVGKAKNLRKRLVQYRVANPERLPRRIIQLLNQTTRIEFDLCANESAARYREAELISALLPKFNRSGKVWPRP